MNAKISRFLSRTLLIEKGELRQLLAAFFYFFLLLCSYYILRPIRDTLGIAGGSDRLPWLFSGTFLFILLIAPLYGWYAHNKNRQKLISRIYFLFIVQLLIFFILIKLRIATYIT
ncbi:MAG: MFS transporter, partial [Calditrichaeota bacterium]|nr:MFS transporter [Calditrichota bacterium]